MRIKDNPFYILEVSPQDGMDVINAAAEDKAFMSDDKADLFAEARMNLASPSKRIDAEFRYLFSVTGKTLKGIQNPDMKERGEFIEACLKTTDDVLDMVCLEIERFYLQDDNSWPRLLVDLDKQVKDRTVITTAINKRLEQLNESRGNMGMPIISVDSFDYSNFMNLVRQDLDDAMSSLLVKVSLNKVVDSFNKLSELIKPAEIEVGDIVETVINRYAMMVSSDLQDRQQAIMTMIEGARNYSNVDQLEPLCEATRAFDYVAQPIQVFLLKRGMADRQEESNKVAYAIRDLALYYNNELSRPKLSAVLIMLGIELFSELPQFFEMSLKDKSAISKILAEKGINIDDVLKKKKARKQPAPAKASAEPKANVKECLLDIRTQIKLLDRKEVALIVAGLACGSIGITYLLRWCWPL